MRVMLDLNVLLDVVQRRDPFYAASAATLSKVLTREVTGCIPGHALTTLYYLVSRQAGKAKAGELVDWLPPLRGGIPGQEPVPPSAQPESPRLRRCCSGECG